MDLTTGEMVGERVKYPTPQPATPKAVAETIARVVRDFSWTGPVGVTYPGVIVRGEARTAANVDKSWLGVNVHDIISTELGVKPSPSSTMPMPPGWPRTDTARARISRVSWSC